MLRMRQRLRHTGNFLRLSSRCLSYALPGRSPDLLVRYHLAPGDRNPPRQLGLHLQLVRFGSIRVKRPRNSTRGHPRGKHLVYVMGTGNRTTRCKKRGSNWAASRRENCQKPCKKPCDRLFWLRFAPIGPPQCRISSSAWSSTMACRLLHLRPSGCRPIRCPRFSPRRCFW